MPVTKPLTSNLFPTPALPSLRNQAQLTPEEAVAQLLEGVSGSQIPELPPVKKPEGGFRGLFAVQPPTIPEEARAQLGQPGMERIQDVRGESTVNMLETLAKIASIFAPGLYPVAAGLQRSRQETQEGKLQDIATALSAQDIATRRKEIERKAEIEKLPKIDMELAAKTFLMRQGFYLDTPENIQQAKTYFSSPQGKTEWDAYVEQRYPQSSMVPVQNPDGSVSYQLVSTRKGTALTTGLTKPKQLVPTNMIVDWSQGLNALDNLDVMSKLAEKVPSGLPGWATKKVLESSNIRSALSTVEQLSRKDVIPKDAYDYYAAWANFRISAQSIIKGIPSNYDVISLLQTIGSLDMSPQQRRALLDYSKQLTVRLIEHQVAMQQAAGRSVPEEFTNILRNVGIDPDNVRARAYRDLPDKNKMLADILKTKIKPEESPVKSTEVKKGSAKKSAQEEADEFLKGLGM